MLVVMAIYCLANLAYFYALPVEEVVTSNSTRHRAALPVASKAASTFLGEYGGKLVAVAFVVSAFGALNGSILSNARVPYAMSRDHLFFSKMADLSERTRVPVWALGVQAVWSSLLAVSGTFDQLTDSLLFASWIFYGLVTSAVFVLRRKMPEAARPYRTLGYPVVPAIFVLVSAWLVVNTLIEKRIESVTGLVLILAGLPLFFWFRSRSRTRLG
jgi:APA family basic amino acid/polyamine antiporter